MVLTHNWADHIGSISGLASQATARTGNLLGILGVLSGILASLAAVGFSPEVMAQFGGIVAVGAIAGLYFRFFVTNDHLLTASS